MSVKIFICYAHEDETYLQRLKTHLRPLQREGLIDLWHDRDISAGTEWEKEIDEHLNEANIILLLVSPDFMDSDYCYGIEMQRAIERHERGEAKVIPVILRPVYWQGILGKLQVLPTDAIPVSDPVWHNVDKAFYNVLEGIHKAVKQFINISLITPMMASEQDDKQSNSQPFLTPFIHPLQLPNLSSAHPISIDESQEFTMIRTLQENSGQLSLLIFSSDEQTFISIGYEDTIKVWEVNTWQLLLTRKYSDSLSGTDFVSPDGQILVTNGHKDIKLWNLHTGQLLSTFEEEAFGIGDVEFIAFSFDGHTLTAKTEDDTIIVCDLHTKQVIRILNGYSHRAFNIAVNQDGQTLASVNEDGTINVWNWPNAKILHILKNHTPVRHEVETLDNGRKVNVYEINFSPDGQFLVSENEDGTISVWHHTGQLLHILKDSSVVNRLTLEAFSPNGQILATQGFEGIKLWNLYTGQLIGILKINSLSSQLNEVLKQNIMPGQHIKTLSQIIMAINICAISPSGKFIAIGNEDGTIKVWRKNK